MRSRVLLLASLGLFMASGAAIAGNGQYTLIGWNNLGMHCMDDDYSVFSILPPFNTVDAHLIDAAGKLVQTLPAGVTVTFQAVADPDGSINCTAVGKSNFWQHAPALFGAALLPDTGLTGVRMPGPANTPQPLTFSAGMKWFEAAGIPITPIDDFMQANRYPMMRLTAKNASGTVLAKTDIVLPVSGEMDCRACHGSGSGPAAQPAAGWVNDPHPSRDYRLNILRLHDERHSGSPVFQAALSTAGYASEGLFASVSAGGTPILCAKCHASEALGTGGAAGVMPLTQAMHAKHSSVISPADGLPLDHIASRSSCYQCHPGSQTRCLRGAMGGAVAANGTAAMQCQSCHGNMSAVGASTRTGWLDEPGCGSCHTGTATQNRGKIRYDSVFDDAGQIRTALNAVFATNTDTPIVGKSLYRFSKGHGGLQCSACHGSTHAEFPSVHRNDNLQSFNLQGHVGVLSDCTACHASMPSTITGGPHGMHPISQSWARDHADSARSVGLVTCQACHGTDYRGTVLSRTLGDRSFSTKFGSFSYKRGMEVGCYECHNGTNSSNATSRQPPVVAAASRSVPSSGGSFALSASGTGPVLRIVQQPMHGSVALSGTTATYLPDAGYSGPDFFTYLASDSGLYRDSAPAVISMNVGNPTPGDDSDGDGLNNFLEFALGLDPYLATPPYAWGRSTELVSGQHYLSLTLPQGPLRPPNVTTGIFVSGDLQTWSAGTSMTPGPYQIKARDVVPIEAASRRFLRATATRP